MELREIEQKLKNIGIYDFRDFDSYLDKSSNDMYLEFVIHFEEDLFGNDTQMFWDFYKNLGNKTFFETYKSRMSAIGHQIEVIRGENKKTACCLDLDSECRLLVEYQNGEREYLSSGEISIRRI